MEDELRYFGDWKPGDFAIYSDFGLRSLFIVRILPWPKERGDRFTDHSAGGAISWSITHDWRDGTVCAEVVDTTLVDWDSEPRHQYEHRQEGTIHYYHYTNLYRKIEDLIAKEKRILYPEVLVKMLYDLRHHPGWIILAAYGLRNDTGGGQHRYEQSDGRR